MPLSKVQSNVLPRPPGRVGADFGVLPGHAVGGPERLGQCLLGGEPGGQRGDRALGLARREEPPHQPRSPLDRLGEPVDVADIDPDPDDHGSPHPRSDP